MNASALLPNNRVNATVRPVTRVTQCVGSLGYTVLRSRQEGLKMRYKIRLQKTDEGYSVSCPGLPGCWSQGASEDEAIENIQDAIQEYLAAVNDSLRGDDVREVDIPG